MSSGTRPSSLPEYENPPVTEVLLGVQFDDILDFGTHIGAIWEEYRSAFPILQSHPPIPPDFETFGPPGGDQAGQFSFTQIFSAPRLWFLNLARTQIVQIQPDRLIHNWRKVTGSDDYPRYEAIRTSFRDELSLLDAVVQRATGNKLSLNQCEITYVNQIVLPPDVATKPWQVFSTWRPLQDADLGAYEGSSFELRYLIHGSSGSPRARMRVTMQPLVLDRRGESVIQFTLTVRGRPAGPSVDEEFELFDLGRERIVRMFTAMTTDAMHDIWQRNHK